MSDLAKQRAEYVEEQRRRFHQVNGQNQSAENDGVTTSLFDPVILAEQSEIAERIALEQEQIKKDEEFARQLAENKRVRRHAPPRRNISPALSLHSLSDEPDTLNVERSTSLQDDLQYATQLQQQEYDNDPDYRGQSHMDPIAPFPPEFVGRNQRNPFREFDGSMRSTRRRPQWFENLEHTMEQAHGMNRNVDQLMQLRGHLQIGPRFFNPRVFGDLFENESVDPNLINMLEDGDELNYEQYLDLGNAIGNAQQAQAPQGTIDSLPTQTFTEEGGIPEDKRQCTVCLMDYCSGESVKTLPCGHLFHQECIDKWLHLNRNCPVCKHSVMDASGPG